MDWITKVNYLKRNSVTVARQSGMHPIGQILNFDDQRKFQNRETEHIHVQFIY